MRARTLTPIACAGFANPEGEDKGPFVRAMRDLDASKKEDTQRVLEMLGNGVLNDLCVRVLVDAEEEIEEDSPVAAFIEELRSKPNLHFHVAQESEK